MKIVFSLSCLFFWISSSSQSLDSSKNISLQPVVVTAFKEEPLKETSLNITSLKIDSLSHFGNYNLTDLMAKTPGVHMLSTGVAISKPVIRGLYGNRVLVLLSGLKFDNQQWQEEHGLGLSDVGLSRVEIIKGPMSVLYGSEAIGGIINTIEEEKPAINTKESDVSIRFHSNTLGGLIQAGYKANHGDHWWRIRAGVENNGDYSDGNNDRVLNSRFKGYQLKTTYGFQKKNWISTNNFMSSFNQFGFIFNDIYEFIEPDARWSRNLSENPAHLVLLNILSSENKFIFKNDSKLNINFGVQSNERLENEGSGKISLNMHLLTIQYLAKWEKRISSINRIIISNLGSFEDNTNYGSRKIIPDANMQESNLSGYLETHLNKNIILENGIGVGEKWIKTFFTASVNSPEKDIHPFDKFSTYYNFFGGITFFPENKFNLKFNLASGVRIPNLAELSSNGLHEGVFTYEIGDPSMKNEQNISFNLLCSYDDEYWGFTISPFYNLFNHYVYLSPTTEDWFGFSIYRYKQQDAHQYGSEVKLSLKPEKDLHLFANYEGMISKTEDGNFTPYIPAQKLASGMSYTFHLKRLNDIHVSTEVDHYFAQNNLAPNEISTGQYTLWNIGTSTSFHSGENTYNVSIAGNNLLNTAYYDHLSRFKYFGLLNIGRNLSVTFKALFQGKVDTK